MKAGYCFRAIFFLLCLAAAGCDEGEDGGDADADAAIDADGAADPDADVTAEPDAAADVPDLPDDGGPDDGDQDEQPVGDESLLPGMTPDSYTIPDGWTLVVTQDFESGCPDGQWCGFYSGEITTTRPHGGASSVEGTFARDQASVGWSLSQGRTGSFEEIYLSFYEFLEPQALFNDEFILARIYVESPFQEINLDWFWANDDAGNAAFNAEHANLYIVPQGTVTARFDGTDYAVPKGAWVQWEVHYRPNSAGVEDGFFRVYKDGFLTVQAENVELNGGDMTDAAVEAGGLYTKLVWMTDYPTCSECSTYPGEGTDACTAEMDWWGQPFSDPVCAPTDPPLEEFRRFIDDIIVMKR